MAFSRQGYSSGLPFPSPGDLPDPGIEAGSPALRADILPSEPPGKPPENGETDHKARTGCFQEVPLLYLLVKKEKVIKGSSGSEVKASACNGGDPGLIPGWVRSPGEGNGNPLGYSCLENSMDRGAF